MAKLSVGNKTWSDRINAMWDETNGGAVKGFIAIGAALEKARDHLSDEDYKDMIENRLRFGERTAERLRAVAKDERLATHASLMPPHWSTLYQLSKLKGDQFDQALKDGTIHPDMERKDVPKRRVESPDLPKPKMAVPKAEDGSPVFSETDTAETYPRRGLTFAENPSPRDEGGDSVVIGTDEAAASHEAPALDDSSVTTHWAEHEAPQAVATHFRADADPIDLFVNGLAMAMAATKELVPSIAADGYPPEMQLLPDEITQFIEWLYAFEDAFRARCGQGNEAALQSQF